MGMPPSVAVLNPSASPHLSFYLLFYFQLLSHFFISAIAAVVAILFRYFIRCFFLYIRPLLVSIGGVFGPSDLSYIKNCNASGISSPQALFLFICGEFIGFPVGFSFCRIVWWDSVGFSFSRFILSIGIWLDVLLAQLLTVL